VNAASGLVRLGEAFGLAGRDVKRDGRGRGAQRAAELAIVERDARDIVVTALGPATLRYALLAKRLGRAR
jgi:hypothetical protein